MEAVFIVFGSIVSIVLGCVGIIAWTTVKLRQGLSEEDRQEVLRRLDQLQGEISEVRDLLADFMIREHDEQAFRRLEGEIEPPQARLSPEAD